MQLPYDLFPVNSADHAYLQHFRQLHLRDSRTARRGVGPDSTKVLRLVSCQDDEVSTDRDCAKDPVRNLSVSRRAYISRRQLQLLTCQSQPRSRTYHIKYHRINMAGTWAQGPSSWKKDGLIPKIVCEPTYLTLPPRYLSLTVIFLDSLVSKDRPSSKPHRSGETGLRRRLQQAPSNLGF